MGKTRRGKEARGQQSQHLGGRGRKIMSSKPHWATEGDPNSKQKTKKKRKGGQKSVLHIILVFPLWKQLT
jgi:hypothetical protein